LHKGLKSEATYCNKRCYAKQQMFSTAPVCTDLARIPLNLPLFSKTSLLTARVYSVEHLFRRPYAVRHCPEKPPTSYIYKCRQPHKRSVKTRRKSLVSNKVYLQMAGRACSQDGFSITVMNRPTVAWRRETGVSGKTKPHLGGRLCLIGSRGSQSCLLYLQMTFQNPVLDRIDSMRLKCLKVLLW
jgi:hypothetical protein